MRFSTIISGLCLCVVLAACQRSDDQIQTYRVSKEADAPMPPMMGGAPMSGGAQAPQPVASEPPPGAGMDMASAGAQMGMTSAATSKEIQWKVPAGWKEQPASSMRVGSFLVPGENGQTADVSVVPLSGEAGGDLANVNRWRAQINLPNITEEELPRDSEKITPGGRPMLLVDFLSTEPLIDNRYKKRLIAVTYKQGERTWFFKMVGEDATVRAAKPAFLKFLKSLKFSE